MSSPRNSSFYSIKPVPETKTSRSSMRLSGEEVEPLHNFVQVRVLKKNELLIVHRDDPMKNMRVVIEILEPGEALQILGVPNAIVSALISRFTESFILNYPDVAFRALLNESQQ